MEELQTGEELLLLARRMGIPAAREVRSEPARPFEVALLVEQPADHGAELAHLNVLEAQLAGEPFAIRLAFGRSQVVPDGRGDHSLFLEGRVSSERVVERGDRFARGREVRRRDGSKKAAEAIVESAVLLLEEGGKGRLHGAYATAPKKRGGEPRWSAPRRG